MNKQEFKVLADAIRSYYPREKIIPTREAAELWFEALKDLDFDMAMASVKKHMQTSRWSPTISEIREGAVGIVRPQTTWSDGWEQVRKAIGRFGYCNEHEALESMDDLTRTVVKRLGWIQICTTELDDVPSLRANFRMIYEELSDRENKEALLSDELKGQIDMIQQKKLEEENKHLAELLGL